MSGDAHPAFQSSSAGKPALTSEQWQRSHKVFSWLNWSPAEGTALHETLQGHFPGALPDIAVHKLATKLLDEHGIGPDNTLRGTSICPDEINNEPGDISDMLKNHWGATFPLGGISGAPFVGKTGFGAFSGHVPKDGNIFIFFGPHVAISEMGTVDEYLREGQESHSSACGACIGAYKACLSMQQCGSPSCGTMKTDSVCSFKDMPLDMGDQQMDWVKRAIEDHAQWISKQDEPMSALAFVVL